VRVAFELTLEDHKAFQRYYFTQTKEGQRLVRRNLVITASCLAVTGFVLPIATMSEWMLAGVISGVVLAGLLSGASVLGRSALLDHMVKRSLKAQEKQSPRMSVTLTAEAVSVETDDVKSSFLWSAIKKVTISPSLVILHLAENRAMLVPAHALATAEEFQAFGDLARKLAQEAAEGRTDDE